MAQYQQEDFKKLHDLQGGWVMKTKKGLLVEQWTIVNDSLLTSRSYIINGKDSTALETVQLSYSNGSINYTPSVPNQNGGLPVNFRLVSIENGSEFGFENKEHDFPQRIIYRLGKKTLNASISGETSSGFKEQQFNFTRQ
jgi:hypothetical protein